MSMATEMCPETEMPTQRETATRPRRPRVRLTPERQKLATRYMALARRVARPFKAGWPHNWEDFESAALYALVEAAESFDPTRNVRFSTYAYHRIVGALRDVQRELIALSRPWDLDGSQPIAPDDLPEISERAGRVVGIAADPPVGWEMEGHEMLERWLRRLPPRWAAACRQIYVHGKSQVEAARTLGMSQSRLCIVHRAALEMLHHDWSPHIHVRGGDGVAA